MDAEIFWERRGKKLGYSGSRGFIGDGTADVFSSLVQCGRCKK